MTISLGGESGEGGLKHRATHSLLLHSAAAAEQNCAFCDRSMKFGTHGQNHTRNKTGYDAT